MKQYSNADLCIMLNFQFYNKYSKIPTLLFGDWTVKILLEERRKRRPTIFEERYLRQETNAINHADWVVTMFPHVAEKMKQTYPDGNICHLGCNVINNLFLGKFDEYEIISKKINSKSILFIGRNEYLDSAKILIRAFSYLDKKDWILNIIGLSKDNFENLPINVHCYGFLHKDIPKENELYYNLLINSRFIANPNPLWGAYSSMVEAMYFYNPVLVAPYPDFVKEFGEKISFGIYNTDFTESTIANNLNMLINQTENEYVTLCKNAHEVVKDYTWSNYVDKILDFVTKD